MRVPAHLHITSVTRILDQGSLQYTPEHCLVNGGFPLFWWKKQHVSNGCKMVSFKEPCGKFSSTSGSFSWGSDSHARRCISSTSRRTTASVAVGDSKHSETSADDAGSEHRNDVAMGQNKNKKRTPSEHPNPTTKIDSKMGGEFTYPKMVPLALNHGHVLQLASSLSKSPTHVAIHWCEGKGRYPLLALLAGLG